MQSTTYISPSLASKYGIVNDTNNGGDTNYYDIKSNWNTAQDIIEARNMNFAQGNIFKVAFTFNIGRHDSTNYERELNKIIWFAKRELSNLQKKELNGISN